MSQTDSEESIGKSILTALTQQEVALLLNAIWENILPSNLETVLNQLPTDTQQTLQQILNPSPETKTENQTSLAQKEEIWLGLWREWNDLVLAATEEDGKYIEQEEHWEPPYFNDSEFMEDLEAIAKQMLPLLPNAYEHNFLPKVDFNQVLVEMPEEITDALAEEIELVNEGFYLGTSLTNLLQWEWLKAQKAGQDTFSFTQCIREWEEQAQRVELEPKAFFNFFSQLPEPDLQQIHQGLTNHREALLWKVYLENISSHWYKLYLYCLERYAPESHLAVLRETIAQQWQNGLPVIENLLTKGLYQDGLSVVEETLLSLLSATRHQGSWSPEVSLLVTLPGVFYDSNSGSKEARLLSYYQQAAQALHQAERVNVLSLQLTAFEHRFDWLIMMEAFKEADISETIHQNLFQSWRKYIIRDTERLFWGWKDGKSSMYWWLPWLLDNINDPQKFQSLLEEWLVNLFRDENPDGDNFGTIRLLTHDLAEIRGENWSQYPNFQEVVLQPYRLKTSDSNSRQFFLKQLMPQDLWNRVIIYWQNHLNHWVPQPETARKSDYTEQARWLMVMRELSLPAYERLLAQWRIKHKQRRNLWKALTEMGLS